MPKVSIVLPTYNGSKYLRESIESVINQTFKDWELIIVDDNSSDNSLEIAKEYAAKDSRILYIHNDINKKLPEALNIGFRHAKGEYLTWTSDDNLYLSDALSEMYSYLENDKSYPMVCARILMVDEETRFIREHPKYDENTMYLWDVVGACFMYRRTVLDTVGEYDSTMFCVEDYDYWLRILKYYGKIGYIDKNLYLYRLHAESLTSTKTNRIAKQHNLLRVKYLDWLLEHVKNDNTSVLCLYNDMMLNGCMNEEIFQRFACESWIVKDDNRICDDKTVILFGAGNYGKKTAKVLNNRVDYFVDNDKNKIGKKIDNILVKDYNTFLKEFDSDKQQVVISVGYVYQQELIEKLRSNGIQDYSLWVNIWSLMENE